VERSIDKGGAQSYIVLLEYMNKNDAKEKALVLRALGHPARLQIALGLMEDACNVKGMVECLKIPQATVSQHLSVLRAARIIEGERKGVEICYHIVSPVAVRVLKSL